MQHFQSYGLYIFKDTQETHFQYLFYIKYSSRNLTAVEKAGYILSELVDDYKGWRKFQGKERRRSRRETCFVEIPVSFSKNIPVLLFLRCGNAVGKMWLKKKD